MWKNYCRSSGKKWNMICNLIVIVLYLQGCASGALRQVWFKIFSGRYCCASMLCLRGFSGGMERTLIDLQGLLYYGKLL